MNKTTLSPGLRGGRSAGRARYPDFVRRACLRYVQNRDEAEDLAQEVLLKAAGSWAEFSGASRPSTWLYRVAVNHCLDHLRREKRRRHRVELHRNEWAPEPEETNGDALRAMSRVLQRLREGAGETDRHVLYLRFDLGLTQSGIAEILGVTRAAVGQRLARIHARAALLWHEMN
jgi:RNA polymerase sigma-70 factor (ECF subfamily)